MSNMTEYGLSHETELQEIYLTALGNISDQYIPDEKTLSPDYPLSSVRGYRL